MLVASLIRLSISEVSRGVLRYTCLLVVRAPIAGYQVKLPLPLSGLFPSLFKLLSLGQTRGWKVGGPWVYSNFGENFHYLAGAIFHCWPLGRAIPKDHFFPKIWAPGEGPKGKLEGPFLAPQHFKTKGTGDSWAFSFRSQPKKKGFLLFPFGSFLSNFG